MSPAERNNILRDVQHLNVDEATRATNRTTGDLLKRLKESGEYQRLHDACHEKLMQQQGWKDHLEDLARKEVANGASRVTLEDLVIKLVPAGKSSIQSPVKEELRQLVQESLRKL